MHLVRYRCKFKLKIASTESEVTTSFGKQIGKFTTINTYQLIKNIYGLLVHRYIFQIFLHILALINASEPRF